MSPLLARLGQLELSSATTAARTSQKRKRVVKWACAGCRKHPLFVLSQRRYSSEATLRWGLGQFDVEEREEDGRAFRKSRVDETHKDQAERGRAEEERTSSTQDSPREAEMGYSPNQWVSSSEAADLETSYSEELLIDASRDDALLDLDYRNDIAHALRTEDADLVARCLFAAQRANDVGFIASISDTTFSKILDLMQPSRTLRAWWSVHMEISEGMAEKLYVTQMTRVAREYVSLLHQIAGLRRSSGRQLTASHYLQLLRGARDLGERNFATALIGDYRTDGHKPTLPFYNLYMSSIVWAGTHDPRARHKDRVIPWHQDKRREGRLDHGYDHFRVGQGGVKERALNIFSDMLRDGVGPDEESFRTVITAAAREGEMDTVKSVLRRVWGVEAGLLLAGDSETELRPKMLPKESPLYPTPRLLQSIAHAFSVNNDIPGALRLTDYLSRTYEIGIPTRTWQTLFEWTFVLSRVRHGNDVRGGGDKGKLPVASVQRLWDTMTAAPYNVTPTMGMYDQMIKNLFDLRNPDKILARMREGRRLFESSKTHAERTWYKLLAAIGVQERGHALKAPVSMQRRAWEEADLFCALNHKRLKRWLRLLARALESWNRLALGHQFALEVFPRVLWEWRVFAGRTITFEVPTGIVEIEMRAESEIAKFVQHGERRECRQKEVIDKAKLFVGNEWRRRRTFAEAEDVFEEDDDGGKTHR